jgi:hypothetical protein
MKRNSVAGTDSQCQQGVAYERHDRRIECQRQHLPRAGGKDHTAEETGFDRCRRDITICGEPSGEALHAPRKVSRQSTRAGIRHTGDKATRIMKGRH